MKNLTLSIVLDDSRYGPLVLETPANHLEALLTPLDSFTDKQDYCEVIPAEGDQPARVEISIFVDANNEHYCGGNAEELLRWIEANDFVPTHFGGDYRRITPAEYDELYPETVTIADKLAPMPAPENAPPTGEADPATTGAPTDFYRSADCAHSQWLDTVWNEALEATDASVTDQVRLLLIMGVRARQDEDMGMVSVDAGPCFRFAGFMDAFRGIDSRCDALPMSAHDQALYDEGAQAFTSMTGN